MRRAVERTAKSPQASTAIATEWLLDNEHLVFRAADQVGVDLSPDFFSVLPKVRGAADGLTRVEALARESLDAVEGFVDLDELQRFLRAFQSVTVLDIGELWALPAFLRLLLLEQVVVAADDALEARADGDLNTRMAVAVGSLRVLDTAEWKDLVESVSIVDRYLKLDPHGAYTRLDFDTRDRYRSAVEELARFSGLSEARVARFAVAAARQTGQPLGSLLIGRARRSFEAQLGCRVPVGTRLARFLRRHAGFWYFGGLTSVSAGTLVLLIWPLWGRYGEIPVAWTVAALALALIPAMSIGVALANQVATHLVKPSRLPRLDFSENLPDEVRTLAAVPVILADADDVSGLLRQLELNHRGNAAANLRFALLVDPCDADRQELPEDEALLALVEQGIRSLNERYSAMAGHAPFLLLTRERRWNPAEGRWMAWERKRGKLHELNRLLLGDEETGLRLIAGEPTALEGVRYVLTLDADTFVPEGAADRLIATAAHPLNAPRFDRQERVVDGYTVFQPRIETLSDSLRPTWFSRIYQESDGLDLYSHAASDVYQDLFGEGIYAGKGLYDVQAFERSLAGRVPENALLSHDLFEGVHGRCALVSDVTVVEDYPSYPAAYMSRLHRWVRGDWQILPWLFPIVPATDRERIANRLSLLDRWKIFDNLRRSLLAVSLVLLTIVGWWWLPGGAWWSAVPLLIVGVPTLAPAIVAALIRWRSPRRESMFRSSATRMLWAAARSILGVVFLPWQALVESDAISRTLYRLLVSHRHLLEWTAAAATARSVHVARKAGDQAREWMAVSLIPIAIGAGAAVLGALQWRAQGPLLLGWLLAPAVAHGLARRPRRTKQTLHADELRWLRLLARRTWAYFDRLVTPEDHWLPPDNLQLHPISAVARRTSPTNIGLGMLAQLVGSDLGYMPPSRLVALLASTLDSLDRLDRHRGHLLNWYDTRHLRPLPPRFVSTVDSGNLAACAIVVAEGLRELPLLPVPSPRYADGVADGFEVVADMLEGSVTVEAFQPGGLPATMRQMGEELQQARHDGLAFAERLASTASVGLPTIETRVAQALEADRSEVTVPLGAVRAWVRALDRQVMAIHEEMELLVPWLGALANAPAIRPGTAGPDLQQAWDDVVAGAPTSPTLRDIPAICGTLAQRLHSLEDAAATAPEPADFDEVGLWAGHLMGRLETARQGAESLLRDIESVSSRLSALVRNMDFTFLYDSTRKLLRVGYHVDGATLDRSHYDLYASEARIASYIAIAKGDVPVEHWVHLGRPFARRDGAVVLLSWAGTMFEYLMPSLFFRTFPDSLAEVACSRAVDVQIRLGRRLHVPWGASESGYDQTDAQNLYRYRAFGAGALSLRWDATGRVVSAPYASVLALTFDPRATVDNLRRLEDLGMGGMLGFYEAADFGLGGALRRPQVVRSFMAHHQGMILAALDNFLSDSHLVERFHRDSRVATFEYLLHEAPPGRVRVHSAPSLPRLEGPPRPPPPPALTKWKVEPDVFPTPTIAVSNGALHSLVMANGSGGLRWRDRDVLRWRPDPTVQSWGTWIYVRDVESNALWSATLAPTWVSPRRYDAIFGPESVEFHREDHRISMRTTVTVAVSADVEIRRVTLVNESLGPRTVELTSYAEVALADPAEDRRHPAFSKLFVEGRYAPLAKALLLERRVRGEEDPMYLAHAAAVGHRDVEPVAWALDRGAFLGRYGSARRPLGVARPTVGIPADTPFAPIDPIMSLTARVALPPGESVSVAFLTSVADAPATALANLDAYRSPARTRFAASQARDRERALLQELSIDGRALPTFQRLLTAIVHPYHVLRQPYRGTHGAGPSRQEVLWSTGASGDLPVVLLQTADENDSLLESLVRAQAYWERHGVRFDVVVVSDGADGYQQPVLERLQRILSELGATDRLNRSGGVHDVPFGRLSGKALSSLRAAAALTLVSDGRSLTEHLARLEPTEPLVPPIERVALPGGGEAEIEPVHRPTDLQLDNGVGGFAPAGREYVVHLEPGQSSPAPWSNVIAHEGFGFLVTESGGGFTWFQNSGERRLTAWRNDPVSDVPSEILYLRDEETADIWSVTRSPAPAPAAYQARHRRGSTAFLHRSHGLDHHVEMFAPPAESVKVVETTLVNEWDRPRRLTATYFAEWVLDTHRWASGPHVTTEVSRSDNAIFARNPFSPSSGGLVAFVAASEPIHSFTCDRTEFIGPDGDFSRPEGLLRIGLEGRAGSGLDPCAALQIHLDLAPGEARKFRFLVGAAATTEGARDLLNSFRDPATSPQLAQVSAQWWADLLERVTVRTPEPTMDLMLNGWLLYQTLSCRLWGRSGLYQSSGAFGFRDQLQDSLAVLATRPELTRGQILEAARHQFLEGDVMHWWHPETDRGVRTRCSDDFLWLPFAVAEYLDATGDTGILDVPVEWMSTSPLGPEETERYDRFDVQASTPLYEHCLAALRRAAPRSERGLPLIGSGDWNDALNRVGLGGRGESIWLGWFLYAVQNRFARVARLHGDTATAEWLCGDAEALRGAVEAHAWDGAWYLRATYDDGTPIGTSTAIEARIDSLTQSWAVLSGGADPERARTAMRSVYEHLVRKDERLVLLLTPPFHESAPDPGYIRSYPPGVRENGGQYTHAATWVGLAFVGLSDGDRAEEVFRLLNPILHASDPASARLYRVEPYVTAGDVYGAPPHTGRGGWTWYTGSAGWLYRLGMEGVLGLRPTPGGLEIKPCIPRRWPEYEATVRVSPSTSYRITVRNPDGLSTGTVRLRVDGQPLDGSVIRLDDDGSGHEVEALMTAPGQGTNAMDS